MTEWKVGMTSGIGNKRGFTLIEVLLSVSLLAIGLASILGGYREILGAYGRARLSMVGLNLLEEKMAEQELEIRGGPFTGGLLNGKEGSWNWSTQTVETGQGGWYEIKGEVRGTGKAGAITLYRYVRR